MPGVRCCTCKKDCTELDHIIVSKGFTKKDGSKTEDSSRYNDCHKTLSRMNRVFDNDKTLKEKYHAHFGAEAKKKFVAKAHRLHGTDLQKLIEDTVTQRTTARTLTEFSAEKKLLTAEGVEDEYSSKPVLKAAILKSAPQMQERKRV